MPVDKKPTKTKKKAKSAEAPTRTRDRAAAEARLREAGLEIFSKYGVDGATTKLISQRAEVNEALIIRYFGGKEGLLLAILEGFANEQNNEPLAYPEQATLQDELTSYMQIEFEVMVESKDFIRTLISKVIVDKKFAKTVSKNTKLLIDERLVRRLESFKQRKLVASKVDLRQASQIVGLQLFGALFVCFTVYNLERIYIDEMLTTFAHAFARGLAEV